MTLWVAVDRAERARILALLHDEAAALERAIASLLPGHRLDVEAMRRQADAYRAAAAVLGG